MPEQVSTSFAEKNAALRRGTRNRIAKRRPDFVDPFSLRKKRKTKVEGDELLSALSPCSEEGNLKVKLPQNLPNQDSTEKKHNSSSFEGQRTISEVVHSLPTSNPKVRVIIRRKPHPDVPKPVSVNFVPCEKPSIKLRLRLKPPQPTLKSKVHEASPIWNERQQADTVHTSSSKVTERDDGDSPRKALRKSPRNKSPRKLITKVKLLVSPRPIGKNSSQDGEEIPLDRSQQRGLESGQRPQKKKRSLEPVEAAEDSRSSQAPTKASVPIEDGTGRANEKPRDAMAECLSPNPKSEPKEEMNEMPPPRTKKQKRVQSSESDETKEDSKLDAKTPEMNVKLALRVNSLPIRKRPYMREERVSSSPVLRRSTRNRQRQGYSR